MDERPPPRRTTMVRRDVDRDAEDFKLTAIVVGAKLADIDQGKSAVLDGVVVRTDGAAPRSRASSR